MGRTNYIIGVDFDNTLVNYDGVMHETAVQFGFIQPDVKKNKKEIRDAVRQLPEGEIKWQRLQAFVYGKGMENAVLIEGVPRFFNACRSAGLSVYIVSHKTDRAARDESGMNLRDVALAWMKKNRFFEREGLGLSSDHVYFESTRQGKIERIEKLRCTHFIDDLEETFLESSFPDDVEKIFFDPPRQEPALPGVKRFASWREIYEYFFETRR